MITHPLFRTASVALLLLMLNLSATADAGVCQSDDIQQDIACLKDLGISIDRFTEEYLQWVSDLRSKLKELSQEEAWCSNLRLSYEEDPSLSTLGKITSRCEGEWLEDRTRRLNRIKNDYIDIKDRYKKIRQHYEVAKELLKLIESRQQRLEREYAESGLLDR